MLFAKNLAFQNYIVNRCTTLHLLTTISGLQNSERLSIAALRQRFRYYKCPAIGATNDGVRIGAKTINDPEVDRGNLNSLLYSVSAGMAKERTAHACL